MHYEYHPHYCQNRKLFRRSFVAPLLFCHTIALHLLRSYLMLLSIEETIKKGQFSGCNINIKPMPNQTMAAVLTFLLPVNTSELNASIDNKNNDELDRFYALRSALASPLLAVDTSDGLEAAIEQTLANVSESFCAGAKVLSAMDVSALVEQATDNVTSTAKKPQEKTAVKSSKKTKSQSKPKAVTEVEEASQVEEEPQVVEHSWEKELDSL